jgi:hypothetical protein
LPLVGPHDHATGTVPGKGAGNYLAAQKAKDPEIREVYLELMRNWRDLAEEIEHFEHAWLDREGI